MAVESKTQRGQLEPDKVAKAAEAIGARFAIWCETREHEDGVEAVATAMCDGEVVCEVPTHEVDGEACCGDRAW